MRKSSGKNLVNGILNSGVMEHGDVWRDEISIYATMRQECVRPWFRRFRYTNISVNDVQFFRRPTCVLTGRKRRSWALERRAVQQMQHPESNLQREKHNIEACCDYSSKFKKRKKTRTDFRVSTKEFELDLQWFWLDSFKSRIKTLSHNFAKCWPIFIFFSPSYSSANV